MKISNLFFVIGIVFIGVTAKVAFESNLAVLKLDGLEMVFV